MEDTIQHRRLFFPDLTLNGSDSMAMRELVLTRNNVDDDTYDILAYAYDIQGSYPLRDDELWYAAMVMRVGSLTDCMASLDSWRSRSLQVRRPH